MVNPVASPFTLGLAALAGAAQYVVTSNGNPLSPIWSVAWGAVAGSAIWDLFLGQRQFSKTWRMAVPIAGKTIFCLAGIIAIHFIVNWTRPTIVFTFENRLPWLTNEKEIIPIYNAHRVAIKIEPSLRLTKATAYIIDISKLTLNKIDKNSLNYGSKLKLGWFESDRNLIYAPRNVPPSGEYVMLFLGEKDGHNLQLTTEADYAYIRELTANMPQGDYCITIDIDAENIALVPKTSKTFKIHWPGEIEKFKLKLLDDNDTTCRRE